MVRGRRAAQQSHLGIAVAIIASMLLVSFPLSSAQAAPVRVQHSVALPKGSHVIGPLPRTKRLALTAALSSRNQQGLQAFVAQISNPASSQYRHFLQPSQFRARFGATPSVITSVKAALRAHGFSKFSVARNGLSVQFSGSAASVESTFRTGQVMMSGGRFANVRTPLLIGPLAAIEAIFGLSNAKSAFSHATRATHRQGVQAHGAATNLHVSSSPPLTPCSDATSLFAGSGANFPLDLAEHYAFKALYDASDFGQDVHIGIQEFEPFTPADIAAYQSCLGTSTTINTINVGDGPSPDDAQVGEAALDIEIVIGQAPEAIIDVYQAKNDGLSTYDMLSTMVTANTDQILVTSWGLCETLLSEKATNANQLLYLEAAAQGQSFIAAAGDSGSQDCAATPGVVGVDSPASQPNVLGVGGTSKASGPDQVWNTADPLHPEFDQAGGGGISTMSCMALSQEQSATVPGILNSSSVHDSSCSDSSQAPYRRQVPDVSAVADPATGYPIFYDAQWQLIGGTSAAAPLWAAIGALINASPFCSSYESGSPGVQVASIYAAAAEGWGQMFTDVTVGNNDLHHELSDTYPATVGYDQASGLGTPLVVGLDGQGVAKLELPGLAARICHMAATTNATPVVSKFTPSAVLPGSSTVVTISGTGFLTIAGSTVVHLDATHTVTANCTSQTTCTFETGQLATKVYAPTIEVERLASSSTPAFTVTNPTSTSLVASATPTAVSFGAQATLRAVLTPSLATGSVVFSSGATTLCSATIVSGTATCLTDKSLGIGTYQVLAKYAGGGPFGSSSGSTSLEVAKSPTAVTVSALPAAPVPGAAVVITARVTPNDATGVATVSIGNGASCTATLIQGTGSCSTPAPTALGPQPVHAYYPGDSLHDSSSTTGSLTVQRALSTTTMTRPPTAVSADGKATWSVAVNPSSASGVMVFSAVAGGVKTGACTATITSGRASCTAVVLAKVATIQVTATFGGSSTVAPSAATATYSVAKVASVIKVTVAPVIVAVKKTFVLSVSSVTAQATGVVTFKVGAVVLCTASLVGGAGKCSAKPQAKPGRITVSAMYAGDGAHLATTTLTPVTVR